MNFKTWLEVGMGGGGPGSGLEPPRQNPIGLLSPRSIGAYQDYSDDSGRDPANPDGQLPPVKKKIKLMRKKKK